MYLMCGQMLDEAGRKDEAREWLESGLAAAKAKGDSHAASEIESALAPARLSERLRLRALLVAQPREVAQRDHQRVDVDRLREVAVEAGVERALPIGMTRIGRDGDRRRTCRRRRQKARERGR